MQVSSSWTNTIADFINWVKNSPALILSSVTQFVSGKFFLFANFSLQSIFFSLSLINLLSSLLLLLGLTQTSTLIKHKIVYYAVGALFLWLHAFEFSDDHRYIHEAISFVSGFYVCAYVVQGCAYVKQKLDGKHEPMRLVTKIKSDILGNHNQTIQSMEQSRIMNQFFLIFITLLSTCFFIFIWYHTKVSKSLPYLENNYTILAALVISTLLLYTICILKKLTLFLPALLCLVIYSLLGIRILLDLMVYPLSPQLKQLNLPLESLFMVALSVEGKEKHIRQSTIAIKKDLSDSLDVEHLQEKLKAQRFLISDVFWTAVFYYLYSVTHGCRVHMEYMVTPVFLWYLFNNRVR